MIDENWTIPAVSRLDLERWHTRLMNFPGFEMDHKTFMAHWGGADIVFETPYGIMKIDSLHPGKPCIAHGLFWSPEAFRDLDTIYAIMDYVFQILGLSAILVQIPGDQRSLIRFIKRLGFEPDTPLPNNYVQFRRIPWDNRPTTT